MSHGCLDQSRGLWREVMDRELNGGIWRLEWQGRHGKSQIGAEVIESTVVEPVDRNTQCAGSTAWCLPPFSCLIIRILIPTPDCRLGSTAWMRQRE